MTMTSGVYYRCPDRRKVNRTPDELYSEYTQSGGSLAVLARQYGVSREYIRQVLAKSETGYIPARLRTDNRVPSVYLELGSAKGQITRRSHLTTMRAVASSLGISLAVVRGSILQAGGNVVALLQLLAVAHTVREYLSLTDLLGFHPNAGEMYRHFRNLNSRITRLCGGFKTLRKALGIETKYGLRQATTITGWGCRDWKIITERLTGLGLS